MAASLAQAAGKQQGAPPGPPVVALVCSAGGLDALQRVLKPLPSTFPGAVIVLQHQAPDRVSYLSQILASNCLLPVRVAQHGDRLVGGTVYVVPPGQHAVVTALNTIALIATNGTPLYRPSADLLLTSLALTAADRTIAVVLSGRGYDGATGATALHGFGGVVVASDRASSANFDMPEAAIRRDDAVDYVLPVDEIPARLVALTSR